HLYLSGRDRFFVLIDEPELSLSVPWQRRFLLDIRKASFCAGLVAATHLPFIYDNELRKNTHAVGEFVRGQQLVGRTFCLRQSEKGPRYRGCIRLDVIFAPTNRLLHRSRSRSFSRPISQL